MLTVPLLPSPSLTLSLCLSIFSLSLVLLLSFSFSNPPTTYIGFISTLCLFIFSLSLVLLLSFFNLNLHLMDNFLSLFYLLFHNLPTMPISINILSILIMLYLTMKFINVLIKIQRGNTLNNLHILTKMTK